MREIKPEVFLIGETRVVDEGLQKYLDHIGVPEWKSDAPSDVERLTEVMGRLCYRSFKAGLNPNVTKVREHNDTYIENILKTRHGSVLEHSTVNFIFANVSRVFTHELVRHRIGVAISQESLRYVRLDDLGQWLPTVIQEDTEAVKIFVRTFSELEKLQKEMADHFKLDAPKTPFQKKKTVTSAMRRIAPIGLATTIGWSANLRALRWILDLRTHPTAEEEIRLVFGEVGKIIVKKYPNLFKDFSVEMVDGLSYYKSENSKV